jgi:2-oxoglutarate ferredoxin oxidoreductase subunit gamma
MTEKTVFAGFGGQGIISLGQIWAYCGMKEGKQVSFYPFYGAEKRGGIARANNIVSDGAIASPIVTKATSVVVMNQDSLAVCAETLMPGGLMIVNSSLVTTKGVTHGGKSLEQQFKVVPVAATAIAEGIGNAKFANMVALGALARATGALHLKTLDDIFASFFTGGKAKFIPMNLTAVREGEKAIG